MQKEYWYINKQADTVYVSFEEVLDSKINQIGTTWDDYVAGCWVQLTDDQIAFHTAHPSASVEEVFNMRLAPVPDPEPVPEPTEEEKLYEARQKKIAAVYEQDRFTEEFTVNGMPIWLDKNTRTSLVANTLPAEKAAGKTETTLWYAGQPPVAIPVPIAWLEEKLPWLELYAKATYDTTQSHLAAVYSLSTQEEVEAYDHAAGYPDKPAFTLAASSGAE